MPIRRNENTRLVLREYTSGNLIIREKYKWDIIDERIKSYELWNAEISEHIDRLSLEIKDLYQDITIIPRAFKNLTEGIGKEKFKDNRNYLAYEVIEVIHITKVTKYFVSEFKSSEELINKIKINIYEQSSSEALNRGAKN